MSDETSEIKSDDDWKAQVEKEKAASMESSTESLESTETVAPSESVGPSEPSEMPAMGEMPPASFEVHLSMLFTQCMAALGQVPDPSGQNSPVNKSYAKHFIDIVEMLGEKTKGNLTDDESKMVSEILHAMRMAYVGVK